MVKIYGEIEGLKLWKARQDRWQSTLNSKPLSERLRINASKGLSKEKFIKKHGIDLWKKKIDRHLEVMKNRNWLIDHNESLIYRNIVSCCTKLSRSYIIKRPDKSFHLDHMFSIAMGFRRKIPPEIIGSPINLRWILGEENIKKSYNCCIEKSELLQIYSEWIKTKDGERYLQDLSSLRSYFEAERDAISP